MLGAWDLTDCGCRVCFAARVSCVPQDSSEGRHSVPWSPQHVPGTRAGTPSSKWFPAPDPAVPGASGQWGLEKSGVTGAGGLALHCKYHLSCCRGAESKGREPGRARPRGDSKSEGRRLFWQQPY